MMKLVSVDQVYRLLAQRPLDAHLRRLLRDAHDPDVMNTARDSLVSCLQSFVAEMHDRRSVQFDEHDLDGWMKSFFTWFGGLRKHPWMEPADEATEIPSDARMALFGDWGTGLYGAPRVSMAIALQKPDVSVHLGDVYYSGTPREYAERVMPLWPYATINRACNGNHDMYSGGQGYFDCIAHFQQPSSCFALVNDQWLVLGLDSAYHDNRIDGEQVAWAQRVRRKYPRHGLTLLSHHTGWTAFDTDSMLQASGLVLKLRPDAWYWGHEHRCVFYNRHQDGPTYGRCVGHGGYPAQRLSIGALPQVAPHWHSFPPSGTARTGGIVFDMPSSALDQRYGEHGFVMVTLGASITETVHTSDGTTVLENVRSITR